MDASQVHIFLSFLKILDHLSLFSFFNKTLTIKEAILVSYILHEQTKPHHKYFTNCKKVISTWSIN